MAMLGAALSDNLGNLPEGLQPRSDGAEGTSGRRTRRPLVTYVVNKDPVRFDRLLMDTS